MAIYCPMTVFIHFVFDKQKLRRSAQSQEQAPVAGTPDNEASNSTVGGLSHHTECGVFVVAPVSADLHLWHSLGFHYRHQYNHN